MRSFEKFRAAVVLNERRSIVEVKPYLLRSADWVGHAALNGSDCASAAAFFGGANGRGRAGCCGAGRGLCAQHLDHGADRGRSRVTTIAAVAIRKGVIQLRSCHHANHQAVRPLRGSSTVCAYHLTSKTQPLASPMRWNTLRLFFLRLTTISTFWPPA